jgi:uncharacterized protein
MRQRRLALLIAALFVIFLVVVPLLSAGVGLVVDWMWFDHTGFREIFVTLLKTQVWLGFFSGIVFLLVAGANLWAAGKVAHRSGYLTIARSVEFPAIDKVPGLLRRLLWLGLIFVAWLVSQWAATHWKDYLFATHTVPMSQTDPIFGISLSFYLFRLPFLFFLYHLALLIAAFSLVAAGACYFVEGGIWISPQNLGMGRNARTHLMIVGGVFFLLFAWRARLGMYNLVYAPTGLVYGAGYTDIHVGWPVLWVQLALCVITAVAFFAGAARDEWRPAKYAIGAVVGMAILGGLIAPALVQRYVVAPSELEKEAPFIARNIEYTREAYGLERFDERNFPAI